MAYKVSGVAEVAEGDVYQARQIGNHCVRLSGKKSMTAGALAEETLIPARMQATTWL